MNSRSKSGLFMIELVVVIVVFSFSAAKCLEVFFHSRQTAEISSSLSRASIEVQTAADCYKSYDGDLFSTAELLGGSVDGERLIIYYDSGWKHTDNADNARFCVTITETAPRESTVIAEDLNGAPIFSVDVRGGLDIG